MWSSKCHIFYFDIYKMILQYTLSIIILIFLITKSQTASLWLKMKNDKNYLKNKYNDLTFFERLADKLNISSNKTVDEQLDSTTQSFKTHVDTMKNSNNNIEVFKKKIYKVLKKI